MAVVVTVATAADPAGANVITVTGIAAGTNVITIRRSAGTALAEAIGGQIVVSNGTASYVDYLYPLDVALTYSVYDSTGATLLGSAVTAPVPSGGTPWIRDAVFPGSRYSRVIIADVTDRTRAGRITPYYVSAVAGAVVAGDVRSLSNGTLMLYCRSHTERDAVVYAMSGGSPCQLRVPAGCQSVVDEMLFAPLDITETRLGTAGACLLTVDFLEVDPGELVTFKPVTYGVQKSNAATAALDYAKLKANFTGRTYRDMYLSATGIEP